VNELFAACRKKVLPKDYLGCHKPGYLMIYWVVTSALLMLPYALLRLVIPECIYILD